MRQVPPRVVIAPDSFKGSLSASGVARALAEGLREARPDVEPVSVPVADGGEGTVAAVLARGWRPVTTRVPGPWGDPVAATWAVDPSGATAVVELAAASGIALPGPDTTSRPADGPTRALTATTRGTGALVAAALDHGCQRVVLAVGGSASTDGGAGMLSALGVRLLDDRGRPVPDGGAGLETLAGLDLSGLDARLRPGAGRRVEVLLAADVDSPLLGDRGAAAVFAPQKGADEATVARLETALARWAEALGAAVGTPGGTPSGARDVAGLPGAGAAGGTGYAALLALGARRVPGVDFVLDLVGLDDALDRASLVVTGEGRLDRQTLAGKAPLGVLRRARDKGVPVVGVCGSSALSAEDARAAGFTAVHALTDLEPDVDRCTADAAALLRRTGAVVAGHLPRRDRSVHR